MLPSNITRDRQTLEAYSQEKLNSQVIEGLDCVKVNMLGVYPILVDPLDLSVGKNIAHDGYWELWVTQCIAKLVQEDWVCVDVGANFGYYTILLAAAVGPKGTVYAFEPQWELASMINLSANLNEFKNIEVSDFAVSDQYKRVVLNIPLEYGGDASIMYEPDHEFKKVEVQSTPLDSVIHGKVDLIKVDAEGSEEKVWAGMKRILTENPDIIVLMEWYPPRLKDAQAFVKDIKGMGFATYFVTKYSVLEYVSMGDLLGTETLEMLLVKR